MTKSSMTKSLLTRKETKLANRRNDAHEIREHEINSSLFLYFYYRLKTETDLSHEQIEGAMKYCFDFTENEGKLLIKEEYENLPKNHYHLMENICDSFSLTNKERTELFDNYFDNWARHASMELSGLLSQQQIVDICRKV